MLLLSFRPFRIHLKFLVCSGDYGGRSFFIHSLGVWRGWEDNLIHYENPRAELIWLTIAEWWGEVGSAADHPYKKNSSVTSFSQEIFSRSSLTFPS